MRVLFVAGGTGGHVFPALSLARALLRQKPGATIAFVGTPRGMETELVPAAGFTLKLMNVEGVKGKGTLQRLKSVLLVPRAILQANRILADFAPDAVVGIGGYASGPVLFLAATKGILTAILEPNAVPGFSNRALGRFVRRIFVAFPIAQLWFGKDKAKFTGNPIREEILAVQPPTFGAPNLRVLVFGGSQGAHRINQAVCDMLRLMGPEAKRFSFIHQTGKSDVDPVREAYRKQGVDADVRAFIDDMAAAYAASDLVIARSGSSVLEIAACGRPSILVPYPYAADDHQLANARVLEQKGAAIVIDDRELSGEKLWNALRGILGADERRAMGARALELRRADAATDIVRDVVDLWEREGARG